MRYLSPIVLLLLTTMGCSTPRLSPESPAPKTMSLEQMRIARVIGDMVKEKRVYLDLEACDFNIDRFTSHIEKDLKQSFLSEAPRAFIALLGSLAGPVEEGALRLSIDHVLVQTLGENVSLGNQFTDEWVERNSTLPIERPGLPRDRPSLSWAGRVELRFTLKEINGAVVFKGIIADSTDQAPSLMAGQWHTSYSMATLARTFVSLTNLLKGRSVKIIPL